MLNAPHLTACPDCDLLQRLPSVPPGATARCPRCDRVLARGTRHAVERAIALALASLVFLACANLFPFLRLEVSGRFVDTTIPSSVATLWAQDLPGLAAIVFATTIAAPLIQLLMLLYVVVPLEFGRRAHGAAAVFRLMGRLRPWSMTEVFMLGVLVSLVKLADMADIVPGVALAAFSLMILTLTATFATLDEHGIWERLAEARE
jgi:paraquat-inducible protein A